MEAVGLGSRQVEWTMTKPSVREREDFYEVMPYAASQPYRDNTDEQPTDEGRMLAIITLVALLVVVAILVIMVAGTLAALD
jgi:nitric oxide reductase large subunit